MNPSYENGGQHVPGVKPGIIASGPDPVTPVNPAQTNPASVNSAPANPGVIASGPETEEVTPMPITTPSGLNLGLSRQPTGGRVMNNDIVIAAGESSKSSKKGLIVGGVIAGIIVVVLVVVMAITMGGGGGTKKTGADYGSFSSYLDYLLNTDDFTVSEDSEYDEYEVYGVQAAFYDKDTEYFGELGSLWDGFYEKVKEEDKYSEVSKIMGDIEYQNELMDFITKYMASTIWGEDGLLGLYLRNGLQGAISEVEKRYGELATTIYEPGKEYAEAMLTNARLYLNAFSAADSAGCIVSGEIDYKCVEKNSANLPDGDNLLEMDEDFPKDTVRVIAEFGFRINNDFMEEGNKK